MKRSVRDVSMQTIRIISLASLLAGATVLRSDTHVAASASLADVTTAMGAATSGDTVSIPADSKTWSSGLTVTGSKDLTFMGAGIGQTVITLSGSGIDLNNTESRVSGITFLGNSGSTSAYHVKGNCEVWFEVDNCRFETISGTKHIGVHAASPSGGSDPLGLVWNCEFDNMRVHMQGDLGTGFGRDVWGNTNRYPGSATTFFVEDCSFDMTDTTGNCMDDEYGGHYVFRFNTVIDSTCEAHGITSLSERGNKTVEIYNNAFTRTVEAYYRPMFLRGGTARVFDNTFTGPWEQQIQIDNETGRTEEAKGDYPWPDQLGTGTDVGGEWPGLPTPFPDQAYWPLYQWNNFHDGTNKAAAWGAGLQADFELVNGAEAQAQEDRDLFQYETSFDGTTGMGRGTKSQMEGITPTADYVGFWVTDEGEWNSDSAGVDGQLYQWDGDSWEWLYIPYQYPHPLRSESGSTSTATIGLLKIGSP